MSTAVREYAPPFLPATCRCCGSELRWRRERRQPIEGGPVHMTHTAYEPGYPLEPHAGRCPDNPFTQPDPDAARAQARLVHADLEGE